MVCNFTPVPRDKFRLGVADAGAYSLMLNTDDRAYWGSGYEVSQDVDSEQVNWNHKPHSIEVNLPPLATLFILYKG